MVEQTGLKNDDNFKKDTFWILSEQSQGKRLVW